MAASEKACLCCLEFSTLRDVFIFELYLLRGERYELVSSFVNDILAVTVAVY